MPQPSTEAAYVCGRPNLTVSPASWNPPERFRQPVFLGSSTDLLAAMNDADRFVPTLLTMGWSGTQESLGSSSARQESGWSASVLAGPDFCAS